ncbi:MAG: glycosyl transferase, group 1, partial [Pseudonocardiales bacterium]|nr:glycosyl transferase, group 1 [Pseudonocardiales bacterium]
GAGLEVLAAPGLRRAVRGAAIVHAHGLRAGTTAALARSSPLVVTWHNAVLADGLKGAVLALGERLVARGAQINLAASTDLLARITELGGRDVRLAPVAPPAPNPVRSVAQTRAEFGLQSERGDRPLIVCVGRLHPQKAPEILIEAARRWDDLDPVPLVVIAGSGPLHETLSEQIRSTGAPVRLLGRRDDVADLLAAADLVVLPSRWEARPLAVQEAMQLGRPVVATDVGGVRGLVAGAAVLVPPDDVDALDLAVRELLGDAERRAELGRRAVAVAATWPDEQASADAVSAIYREILQRK